MNSTKVNKFENFLADELLTNSPLIVLNKGAVIFKKYRITATKHGCWDLARIDGDRIHTFNLKSTAIIAAKYCNAKALNKIEELKLLDTDYWSNISAASCYKHSIKVTTDDIKKSILLSRLDIAVSRAKFFKNEILKHVDYEFDKY